MALFLCKWLGMFRLTPFTQPYSGELKFAIRRLAGGRTEMALMRLVARLFFIVPKKPVILRTEGLTQVVSIQLERKQPLDN
jgi:hypothetical protein